MNDDTFRKRQKKVREGMLEAKADFLIVTKPANVTYITGFEGEDSWAIVSAKGVILITDSRYSQQAEKECKKSRIIVRKNSMIKTVAKLLKKRAKNIAIENSSSIADLEVLKEELKCKIKPVANVIEQVRQIKDEGEIAAIKKAAVIAGVALKNAIRQIRAGMSENELAGILELEIRKIGGQAAFETIVGFGPNAARPHHRPTDRKLRKNDTILVDFGVRYKGYCCDITRCFVKGKAGNLYEKVYNAVVEAQAAAIQMVRAGVKIKDVDLAAKNVLKRYGLPIYGHGTGHGIGLEIHEAPGLSAKSECVLQSGEVITIEPAVYIPGKLGVRIEDDIYVIQKGSINLSRIHL